MIQGRCHCGNISFSLEWNPPPGKEQAEIPARACGCTFCQKHGGVWTSNPRGSLRVTVKDPSARSIYNFGTKTADFHVCSRCGVVPVVTSKIDGRVYAVVSVNAFEGIEPSRLKRSPVDFDGEGTDSRLERRKRGWIPSVEFMEERK